MRGRGDTFCCCLDDAWAELRVTCAQIHATSILEKGERVAVLAQADRIMAHLGRLRVAVTWFRCQSIMILISSWG